MILSELADYVKDKISSCDVSIDNYITTDNILQNKNGREIATNLPPKESSLTQFKKGDVLVANIRPYLKKVWYADCDGGCSSDVLVFRAKEGHSSDFLFSVLLQDAFYDYATKGAKGSKMPRGDKDQIMRYKIPTLSSSEESIGRLIISINKKIAINCEINRNLEAQAKQLYDYWFVQFDFPDENGKPYKSSGGEMVWNEKLKREIPKGWKVKDIKSFMRIFTGKKDVSKAIPGKYKFFSCAPEPITSNEYIFDGAAVLISGNGSYTGRVNFYCGKMDLYQRTYACVLDNNDYKIPFFYYTLKYLFQPIYSGGKHGSSIPYIVLGDLADFMYAYNSEVVDDFITQIQALFNKQILNKSEIEHLTKQRDELLPLLMNGQVSIKPTEVNCDLSHD